MSEPWFDGVSLELNPSLVAVIGRKGSGKSALVDVLGLLGNSHRQADASFLSDRRFKSPSDNKAKHFEAELHWESADAATKCLDDDTDVSTSETVTYIPQNLFEEICNELARAEPGKFDQELKRVIFSHVPDGKRLGCEELDALLQYRTEGLFSGMGERRARLSELNKTIVAMERKLTDEYRRGLVSQLEVRSAELDAHERTMPEPVEAPPTEPDERGKAILAQIASVRGEQAGVEAAIADAEARRAVLAREVALLERIAQRLATFERTYWEFTKDTEPALIELGIDPAKVARLELDQNILTAARNAREIEVQEIEGRLTTASAGSLVAQRQELSARLTELRGQLDEPEEHFQAYLGAKADWEARFSAILGSEEEPGTVRFLEAAVRALDEVPDQLKALRSERRALAHEIHGLLQDIAEIYRELYGPVQQFIVSHQVAKRFQLRVDVGIVNARFEDGFFDWINRGRIGTFSGVQESSDRIGGLLRQFDFNIAEKSIEFAEAILDQLAHDSRTPERIPVRVADQLRQGRTEESLADFLFGFTYLEPRYGLRMGTRDLHQLSPGEKGALLLVFYLLVDRNDTPLIIDQPEENLDNETIVELLVPSIKEAKRRRQIVVVTHNPNLAVVCDAEQVIWANRASVADPTIRYEAGAIENPAINKRIVDVLEGTRLAFDNRKDKYH